MQKHAFVWFSGLSGGPDGWMWTNGQSLSFSRLRVLPLSRATSGSDCVLVQNPRTWITTSCWSETHMFVCSSVA